MRSIQRRLSLGLIAVLLIVGILFAQISLWLFEFGLQRYLEAGLRNESENLLVALVQGEHGIQLDDRRVSAAYQRPYSGHYYRIDFGDTHWRSRSLWDLSLPALPRGGLHSDLTLGPEGQSLLAWRGDYQRLGENISISVAQDYTPVRASFQRMQYVGFAIGLMAVLLILVLQRITVTRALRPLERAREQIAQLQLGQRSQLDTQVPLELEPLVGQINHLLAHTESSLKRSRNALGNLGHALKTPLAVLLSLSASEALADHTQAQLVMRQQLGQIQRRLSRELTRARLAGDLLPSAQFECAGELPGLVATLQMIHGDHLHVHARYGPSLRFPLDREDMLELLGNLLDNACKWADSEVCLTLHPEVGRCIFWIDDDGPGIPPAQRIEVLARGSRLDEQREGHGLGLAIVRDIADSWGARLELGESPLGGLRVTLMLPTQRSG